MSQKSFKTRIEYGDTADYATAATWTPFAKVLSITPPPLSADSIESTHLESPDEMKEFEPGLGDGGTCTFKLQWAKAQHASIIAMWRQKKSFRIVYSDLPQPSGSKLRFNGFVQEISPEEITKDNLVEAEVQIKVSGKSDFVPAA